MGMTYTCSALAMALVGLSCVSTTPTGAVSSGEAAEDDVPEVTLTQASACDQLASACHFNEPLGRLVHECHVLAHDGDPALCAAHREQCVNACRNVEKRRATARHGPQPRR